VTCGRSVVFYRYSTNKTDRHYITEILLKVALNTITLTQILQVMGVITSFNNISVILMEEVRVPGENP
jgi:hypothetical protein